MVLPGDVSQELEAPMGLLRMFKGFHMQAAMGYHVVQLFV